MQQRLLAVSALSGAVGLALALQAAPVQAQMNSEMTPQMTQKLEMMLKDHPGASKNAIEKNMQRASMDHLAACYGINAVGRNDCAAGTHSCAGQATQARDPNSFVLLPAGDCSKIAGGSLKPA